MNLNLNKEDNKEKKIKIGIAGCGGIGSNVCYHLVRTSDFDLKFGDFDKIEESNLNRQFYFKNQVGEFKSKTLEKNLKAINPYGNYEFEIIKFDRNNIKEFFKDCEIIVEGFDDKETKAMLVEEIFSMDPKKIIVSASGISDFDTKNIRVREVMKNFIVVGDFEKDSDEYKLYSHKVNMISCIMTEIILKFLKEASCNEK